MPKLARLCITLAGPIAALAIVGQIRAEPSAADLIKLLEARQGAISSYEADVHRSEAGGRDRAALARVKREFAAWLSQHQPSISTKNVLDDARNLEADYPAQHSYVHYSASSPGLVRIENYGPTPRGKGSTETKPEVYVFSGDRWEQYAPPGAGAGSLGYLYITTQSGGMGEYEVARGHAVPAPLFLKISNRASVLHQMDFAELLRHTGARRASASREPIPGQTVGLPALTLETVPPPQFTWGSYRYRIWFDPEHGLCPIHLICQRLSPVRRDGTPYYLTDRIVTWDKLVEASSGIWCPGRARIEYYVDYARPLEGGRLDGNDWPSDDYQLMVATFDFSNVRINEPLDPARFTIKPPAMTNIIDEVNAVHKVTGSAGEIIRNEALRWREDLPPRSPTRFWTWLVDWWMLILAMFFVAGLIASLYRRFARPGGNQA